MKDIEKASQAFETVVNITGRKDPRAWARRILERNAKGERVPRIAVEMAMEVVYGKDGPEAA